MDKLSLFAFLFALAGIVMIFALSSGIGGNGIAGSGSNALAGSSAVGTGSNSGSVGCGGGGCGSVAGGCGCGGGITNTGGSSGSNAGGAGGSAAGSAGGSSAEGSTEGNGAGSVGGVGAGSGSVQDVYIKALGNGRYDKGEVRVKAGVPVRFHFSAEPNAGCGKLVVMEEFGVRLVSYNGEEKVAEFTPTQKGTYEYHCGMHMFVGRMIVE